MQSKAKVKYLRISPSKLRPYVRVLRGYTVDNALAWLKTCGLQRVKPISKLIFSAYSNAKQIQEGLDMKDMVIKEIKVDKGPVHKYFKCGAMGRAQIQRKRLSHMEVVLHKNLER